MAARKAGRRGSSCASDCSDRTDYTNSTAPTIFSGRPSLKHHDTDASHYFIDERTWSPDHYAYDEDRGPISTYASTVPSEADLDQDYARHAVFQEPLDYRQDYFEPAAYPSTPDEFAEYFPSTRKIQICHDDTYDGNMNLRLDIDVESSHGQRVDLTLFHLRMHDLKSRQFSLRRYCRDSGREICHSSRKPRKQISEQRPVLQRSMSNALASLRPKAQHQQHSSPVTPPKHNLTRSDSGYDSMSDDESLAGDHDSSKSAQHSPSSTMSIEFANYAHVDLKVKGAKKSKRYEFGYWGTSYAWRRVAQPDGESKKFSFHLYGNNSHEAIAHIVPTQLTTEEAADERGRGGWIPPSTMWISDPSAFSGLSDVADVIVATGLMALVDNTIRQRWHSKDRFRFTMPIPSISKLNMEYVGPKRLIDEVFNRRSTDPVRGPVRGSPLRQASGLV